MGFDDGKQKMEKFDGSYFAFWKTHIEDYLYQKDLYRPLLGKEKGKKTWEYNEDWEVLDRKALGVIRLSLSKSVTHNILKEKTTVGLMQALKEMYEQPSITNKVHLMKKLFNLSMPGVQTTFWRYQNHNSNMSKSKGECWNCDQIGYVRNLQSTEE